VTADRGYGEEAVDDAPHDLGVRHVVIPIGKPGKDRQATEHKPASRAPSMADRQRRPDQHRQTPIRMGLCTAREPRRSPSWTGHGILAHNLVKIACLAG
jgi:IS5 family transposase